MQQEVMAEDEVKFVLKIFLEMFVTASNLVLQNVLKLNKIN